MKILTKSLLVLTIGLLVFVAKVHAEQYLLPKEVNNFNNSQTISTRDIIIPTVIKMPLIYPQNNYDQYLILEAGSNEFQPYQIEEQTNNVSFTVVTDKGTADNRNLYDNNLNTFVDYEIGLDNIETSVTWTFEYENPITTNEFFYKLDSNTRVPVFITIEKIENDKNTIVLYKENISSNNIRFPNVTSSKWRVSMLFEQPMRILELGFTPVTNNSNYNYYLLFLARPNQIYTIYSSPNTYINMPTKESGNLLQATELKVIDPPTIQNNKTVVQPDNDNDGVLNDIDNCISISNPTQQDLNNNNIGDACEDFDNDSILNSLDNCPDHPNKYQEDTDGDGVGDHCDEEESRLTEKIKWLPWLGLIVGFGIVISLIVTTVKTPIDSNNLEEKTPESL